MKLINRILHWFMKSHKKHGLHWTREEMDELIWWMVDSGCNLDWQQIGKKLKRTPSACKSKYYREWA